MHTAPADMEIISQVLQGNQQAYATLVDKYQNFVFTIVLRYVKKPGRCRRNCTGRFYKSVQVVSRFQRIFQV
jgi:RNA polymerase sigma-70 factor (ECF subfamily)